MPNALNTVVLSGEVDDKPKFLQKDGIEFAIRFHLRVERSYRGRSGEYGTDSIPVKYEFDEARRDLVHSIDVGDEIHLSGCIRIDTYKGSPLIQVLAESLSLSKTTRENKKQQKEGEKRVNWKGEIKGTWNGVKQEDLPN